MVCFFFSHLGGGVEYEVNEFFFQVFGMRKSKVSGYARVNAFPGS